MVDSQTSFMSVAASEYTSGIFSDALSVVREEITHNNNRKIDRTNNGILNKCIEDTLLFIKNKLIQLKDENIRLNESMSKLTNKKGKNLSITMIYLKKLKLILLKTKRTKIVTMITLVPMNTEM